MQLAGPGACCLLAGWRGTSSDAKGCTVRVQHQYMHCSYYIDIGMPLLTSQGAPRALYLDPVT